MLRFTNLSESSVSLAEMRLNVATKIAKVKMEIDKFHQLGKLASDNSVALTEMRLTAAIKIATLKMHVDKYQQLVKLAEESGGVVEAKKVSSALTSIQSINKNEPDKSTIKKDVQEPSKTKISESEWVDNQAMKLLCDLVIKKRLTAK